MVTVFHGTTEQRAEKIISDGCISITTEGNRRYPSTRIGYVYVTKDFYQAVDFSTRPEKGLKNNTVVIFELLIDEEELIQDKDEEKWQSTLESVKDYNNCFVICRNLEIGSDVKRIYKKQFRDSASAGKFMQDVQYGNVIINESDKEWENLTWPD